MRGRGGAVVATVTLLSLVVASCGSTSRSGTPPASTTSSTTSAAPAAPATSAPGSSTTAPAGPHPGLASGTRTVATTFDGRARTFVLHVPTEVAAHPDRPVPLVVGLHGGGGSGTQFARNTGLDAEADRVGFVAAYPEGLAMPTRKGPSTRTWDAGICCPPANRLHLDDVGFVASVIADVEAATATDPARVVVAGHSNGAMLTWRIACERPDVLSAAVVVEGALTTATCTPSRGVNLVQIHGDADDHVPIGGGSGTESIVSVDYPSVADGQARWTTAERCGPPKTTTADHLTTTVWGGCADATTSTLIVIGGGSHAWPGADPSTVPPKASAPNPRLSATQAILNTIGR